MSTTPEASSGDFPKELASTCLRHCSITARIVLACFPHVQVRMSNSGYGAVTHCPPVGPVGGRAVAQRSSSAARCRRGPGRTRPARARRAHEAFGPGGCRRSPLCSSRPSRYRYWLRWSLGGDLNDEEPSTRAPTPGKYDRCGHQESFDLPRASQEGDLSGSVRAAAGADQVEQQADGGGLPAPLGPRKPNTSSGWTARSSRYRACWRPYRLARPR